MPDKQQDKTKRLLRKPRQSQRPLPSASVSQGGPNEYETGSNYLYVDGPLDYDFIQNDDDNQTALELYDDKKSKKSQKSNKSKLEKSLVLQSPSMQTSASLVKSKLPRGPSNFPCRPMHRMANLLYDLLWDDDDLKYFSVPAFTLNDFLYHVAAYGKIPVTSVEDTVLSKRNYKKLTKLMAEENAKTADNTLKTIDFDEQLSSIPPVASRVPNRHLLIEMAAMVKEQINEALNTEVQAVIKPLPKYASPYIAGEGPLTEIVIYESGGVSPCKSVTFNEGLLPQQSHSVAESLLQSASPKYFQGAGRSHSPFANNEATDLSIAELCLLDSLAKGGFALSLKAQFLSAVPDISAVCRTLTYLNLSFNDFKVFPMEVLSCRRLTVLKMRNNPLRQIPDDLTLLAGLETFVASFCLLHAVPASVFSLKNLMHLDVSYNRLTFLPDEMKNARKLTELNLEGNSFHAMPCAALKLRRLKSLRVKNNFMHPLFWREATKNEPQTLSDMAALAVYHSGIADTALDVKYQAVINDYSPCDCCGGRCYGNGIRIVRPCTKIFGINNLPFLFRSCGPRCAAEFMNSSDGIANIIYG